MATDSRRLDGFAELLVIENRTSDRLLFNERPIDPSLAAWSVVLLTLVLVLFEILVQTMKLGAFCFTRESWRRKMAARIEAKALPHAVTMPLTMPLTVAQDSGDAGCQ